MEDRNNGHAAMEGTNPLRADVCSRERLESLVKILTNFMITVDPDHSGQSQKIEIVIGIQHIEEEGM